MASLLKSKKLLFFGTGAVGAYYGGMLVKAGYDLTFVARGKHFEVLKEKGLTFVTDEASETLPIKVHDDVSSLGIFDYVFICVKSADTKDAACKIKNNVDKNTSILSFQNGIDNEEIIGEAVGKEKVIGSNVYVTSAITKPGEVYQFGYNAVVIGEFNKEKTKRVNELNDIFKSAQIVCVIADDIDAELWNKLVWNASFNPISVLTETTVDKMLADEKIYKLLEDVMTEVKNVAEACGVNIRKDTVEFNLNRSKGIISTNASQTQNFSGFKTSMLQDYEKGKPLELEALVGVVVRKAKEKNLSVPNIERVYNEVKKKVSVKTKV